MLDNKVKEEKKSLYERALSAFEQIVKSIPECFSTRKQNYL